MVRRTSKTAAKRLLCTERQLQAVDLRKQGMPYSQIAKDMGIAPQTAHGLVTDAMKTFAANIAEETRVVLGLELERLDAMMFGLWTRAIGGDEKAVRAVIKIMERRNNLLGLDAPTKTEHVERIDWAAALADADKAMADKGAT